MNHKTIAHRMKTVNEEFLKYVNIWGLENVLSDNELCCSLSVQKKVVESIEHQLSKKAYFNKDVSEEYKELMSKAASAKIVGSM